MELGLEGQAVVVLGAGTGLGRACALEFAREGASVTLFGRTEASLKSVAEEIREIGRLPAELVVGDISRADDIQRLMEGAAARSGRVDVLFNNGGGPPAGVFADFDDTDWKAAFETTLLGYVRSIRACLPFLRASTHGRVMNNTSSGVKSALDGLILSNVFRLGVVGLTRSLSTELGPEGILVNAIAPGRIETARVASIDAGRAQRSGSTTEAVRQSSERSIALGRYGRPAEFAQSVVFHCSPANTYVTGQVLVVDGGMYKGY